MKSLKFIATLFLATATLSFSSCKKEAELPPDNSNNDPNLQVTHTIAQLKALNGAYVPSTGGDTTKITGDVVIAGIVTADDRSGNFYKSIVIEDSTGGIALQLDAYSLYATLPVGRKVYVQCKGLWLGYDGGLPMLGHSVDEQMGISGIPTSEMSKYIVKASVGHAIKTDTFTVAQAKALPATYYNTLITIKDAEFADSSSKTWTAANATTNRDIEDCSNTKLVVRTSNYADFAQQKLPNGKGTITGILTVYISSSGSKTPQLVVRDASDAIMNGLRCGQGAVTPPTLITIDSVKKAYKGSLISLGNVSITGTVISDRANKNCNGQNMIIQQGNRGIVVRFSATHSFDLGDSVMVNLDGAQLGEFNGLLEVGAVSSGSTYVLSRASLLGTGKSVAPTVVTIAQLVGANFENYESTLVKIMATTLSGGTTWTGSSGNLTMKDATETTGILKHYTIPSSATFATNAIPTAAVNLTGIVGHYKTATNETKQISIRNPATDIQ